MSENQSPQKDGLPVPREDETIEMIQTVTTDILPGAYA